MHALRRLLWASLALAACACTRIEYVEEPATQDPQATTPLFIAPTGPHVNACGEDPRLVLPTGGIAHLSSVGTTPSGFSGASYQSNLSVSPLFLDRVEATKSCYAKCVADQFCAPPELDPQDPDPRDWNDPARAQEAVGGLLFAHAKAFCAWRGGRLPTLGEYVAVAGTGGRPFDNGLGTRLVACRYDATANDDCPELIAEGRLGHRVGGTVNTRMRPPGAWSARDVTDSGIVGLFGGALEWTGNVIGSTGFAGLPDGAPDRTDLSDNTTWVRANYLYHPAASILGTLGEQSAEIRLGEDTGPTTDGTLRVDGVARTSYAFGVRCAFAAAARTAE